MLKQMSLRTRSTICKKTVLNDFAHHQMNEICHLIVLFAILLPKYNVKRAIYVDIFPLSKLHLFDLGLATNLIVTFWEQLWAKTNTLMYFFIIPYFLQTNSVEWLCSPPREKISTFLFPGRGFRDHHSNRRTQRGYWGRESYWK